MNHSFERDGRIHFFVQGARFEATWAFSRSLHPFNDPTKFALAPQLQSSGSPSFPRRYEAGHDLVANWSPAGDF